MSDLNKIHVDATTPHLMPRAAISKDLKALGGKYDVKEEADGKVSVSASYVVDTDADASNGYVLVKANATYVKNKEGNGYTVVDGTAKMEATAKNTTPQSAAALEKYAKSYAGQLLGNKTKTMAVAMTILIPTYRYTIGDAPASGRPGGEFQVPVSVTSPSKVVVKLDGVELYSREITSGETKMNLKVPESMGAGEKNLTFDITDTVSKAAVPTQTKKMKIVEKVDAVMESQFAKLSAVTVKDIKVVGQAKVEGVTAEVIVLEAKKEMQEVNVVQGKMVVKQKVEVLVPTGNTIGAPIKYPKTLTLTNKGQKIELARNLDEKNLYRAQIKNAEGLVLWEGEFSIGDAAKGPGPGKVKPK